LSLCIHISDLGQPSLFQGVSFVVKYQV